MQNTSTDEISKNIASEITWEVPEHEEFERDRRWYIPAGVIAGVFLIYSVFIANFLFAFIIILGGVIYVLRHGQTVYKIKFVIGGQGIFIGDKHYDYDEIKNFTIIYKPNLEIKNLYFEFKRSTKHRLTIPLLNMNPLPIRKFLLQYLSEDLERVNPPISEGLARILRL
jgi:hypothetical protein